LGEEIESLERADKWRGLLEGSHCHGPPRRCWMELCPWFNTTDSQQQVGQTASTCAAFSIQLQGIYETMRHLFPSDQY